jgi:glycine/D-amino acid oxidase-like deaminating enzyme
MGSTCASTGLLQYEIDVPLHELQKKAGVESANRAYLLGIDAIDRIESLVHELKDDCGFARVPSLQIASRKRDAVALEREWNCRRDIGIDVELWNRRDIQARFPFDAPAGLRSAQAGQIDAYRFTHRLFQRGCTHALRIFDRTSVLKTARTQRRWTLTTDRRCTVTADRLVMAGGYESPEPRTRRSTRLHSTYALVSEPQPHIPPWHESCLIWETAHPYLYMRTDRDGRILIGGEDVPFRNPAVRDALMPRKTAKLVKRFNKMFPDIALEVAFNWCGTFAETADGLAYIGEAPDSRWRGCLFALGYGGNGITFSVIAARIIADAILSRANPDAKVFALDR